MISETNCQHPSCIDDADETYTGPHGNALQLCERHYYNAVTDGDVPSVSLPDGQGNDNPINPFWDSGFRCNTTTDDSPLWREVSDRSQPGYNDLATELMRRHQRRGL